MREGTYTIGCARAKLPLQQDAHTISGQRLEPGAYSSLEMRRDGEPGRWALPRAEHYRGCPEHPDAASGAARTVPTQRIPSGELLVGRARIMRARKDGHSNIHPAPSRSSTNSGVVFRPAPVVLCLCV